MNQSEFDDWFEVHCLRFAGVAKLQANDPTIASVYFDRLKQYDRRTLRDATDDVFAMEDQPFPSQHLGKLLSLCRSSQYKLTRSENVTLPAKERINCELCEDRGTVYVYHPEAYQKIRDERFDYDRESKEIVVACSCSRGESFSNKSSDNLGTKGSFPNMLKFCPTRMLPLDGNGEAELVEFVEQIKPKNYRQEFAGMA